MYKILLGNLPCIGLRTKNIETSSIIYRKIQTKCYKILIAGLLYI